MIYQNPHLLYALFAIAIPIIIHLFSFRKQKTVYFSSIRFLKEIKEKNKKKSKLKNILILVSRILAISFLVLAFAKPYVPHDQSENNTSQNVLIYIDNSFSMDTENQNGKLLSIAKEKAKEIVKAYPMESSFWIIDNNFLEENNNRTNATEIKKEIDEIMISSSSKSLKQIIHKQTSLLSNEDSHLFIISDMQASTLKVKDLHQLNSRATLFMVPIISNNKNNISIDSCWIESPLLKNNEEITLFTTISNQSIEKINQEVVFLELNGQQKSQQYISLNEQESKTIQFTFNNENHLLQKGIIKINDYPVTFDNNYYFTLKHTKKINVLCINSDNKSTPINTLFKNDTALFKYKSISIDNINYSDLQSQNCIFINEVQEFGSGLINVLKKCIQNGISIAIFPPRNIDLTIYNDQLKELGASTLSELKNYNTNIDYININHPLYKKVFDGDIDKINYPEINKYHEIISHNNSTSLSLLKQDNEAVFLEVTSKEKGLIYLFNSPLNSEYNNFSQHALFVPTLLNIATSNIRTESIYNTIHPEDFFTSSKIINRKSILHLKNENIDIIPTQKTHLGKQIFYTQSQITENGIYSIVVDNKIIDAIAYNYNPLESKYNTLSIEELNKWKVKLNTKKVKIITAGLSGIENTITKIQNGKEYWKIAILLSLLFFALEILLIKLIKI